MCEVTVYGELLLGSDEPGDATGDGGYRAVLYCDGELVRRLNAQHDDINYPLSIDEIIHEVNDTLASGDRRRSSIWPTHWTSTTIWAVRSTLLEESSRR